MKTYQFLLSVTGAKSQKQARIAVLTAFAKRNPDGCEFNLRANRSDKEAFIAGSEAGAEVAWDLMMKALEKFGKDIGIKRNK